MNHDSSTWCHDCDIPVVSFAAFDAHASAGHAISEGRCPGVCQFKHN